MRPKTVFMLILSCYFTLCEAEQNVEARGKKKKIALFVWFVDLVIKKFFVLKLIYAFVFWAIIHKAGYIFSWFIQLVKEKKHDYYHDHHDHHPHFEYGHHFEYGSPQQSYGPPQYSSGPYRRHNSAKRH